MDELLKALGIKQREDGLWGQVFISITQGPGEPAPQIHLVALPAIPKELAKENQASALEVVCAKNRG